MALCHLSIPYHDPAEDFQHFADLQGSFFLDSSHFHPKHGRYSFWGISPAETFESKQGFIKMGEHTTIDSPLSALKSLYQKIASLPHDPYFPFCGGLVGFLSYEWGAHLENVESPQNEKTPNLPDAWFGLYDTIVAYDHLELSCRVIALGLQEDAPTCAQNLADRIKNNRRLFNPQNLKERAPIITDWQADLKKEDYLSSIKKILDYLRAGDCYQINFTQRFRARTASPAWQIFNRLRKISPSPFGAFLQGGDFQILSSSPELFLQSHADGSLLTRPIKGTRKRGKNADEDARLRAELFNSPKDNAELLMITDLERNDFGKICEPGSVEVLNLKEIESYEQVHHLISTIQGKRKSDCDIIDCLSAMMPGGSITGAPKIRAMQVIQELEPEQRGVYTGAIGWLGPTNTAHFNIAIRTIILQNGEAFFHAGGGIVIDSDPQAEYEESLTKAKGMMQALNITSE